MSDTLTTPGTPPAPVTVDPAHRQSPPPVVIPSGDPQ